MKQTKIIESYRIFLISTFLMAQAFIFVMFPMNANASGNLVKCNASISFNANPRTAGITQEINLSGWIDFIDVHSTGSFLGYCAETQSDSINGKTLTTFKVDVMSEFVIGRGRQKLMTQSFTYSPNQTRYPFAATFTASSKGYKIGDTISTTAYVSVNGWDSGIATEFMASSPQIDVAVKANDSLPTINNGQPSQPSNPGIQQPGVQQPANPGPQQQGNPGAQQPSTQTPCTDPNSCLYNPLPEEELTHTFLVIMQGLLGIVAIWAVIFIIIGGFQMVMSAGNEEGIATAKKTITWAILGLVFALLSFSIVAIVQNLLKVNIKQTGSTSYKIKINTTI